MYKIYSLKKYSDNLNLDPTLETDNIKDLYNALKVNKGYHLKLIDDVITTNIL